MVDQEWETTGDTLAFSSAEGGKGIINMAGWRDGRNRPLPVATVQRFQECSDGPADRGQPNLLSVRDESVGGGRKGCCFVPMCAPLHSCSPPRTHAHTRTHTHTCDFPLSSRAYGECGFNLYEVSCGGDGQECQQLSKWVVVLVSIFPFLC